jgi:hypothetical protein
VAPVRTSAKKAAAPATRSIPVKKAASAKKAAPRRTGPAS